ncbi:MAG: aminotransferase [Acidobacteria bacterium]|nr:aminotransferase [Acidobacteriota bacterium]MYD70795.1 aminotransferase [Acidobacteriota bacterium]MYJ06306.1 aminotransferase [Acidobacteriota bacterium]
MFDGLTTEALAARERELAARFSELAGAGLNLDLTRGKPSPQQVALSDPIDLTLGGDYRLEDGTDVRNYGGLTGIPEARRLGAEMLGVSPDLVIAGGNSSLTFMYQYVLNAWLNGPLGPGSAWREEGRPLRFLCVVPGYDRHFTITQSLGFELVSVPIRDDGPDMDMVEGLVAEDAGIKGIWCVPKYSNPTGCTYSDAVLDRFAQLARRAGPHFRILWDNAYAVHDLDDNPPVLANLMERARDAGTEDNVVMFTSTSKITRAGAGVSFIAMSPANRAPFTKALGTQTIGPDKVNQLRHVRYLGNLDGIRGLMRRHATIVRPKFERVLQHLGDGLRADGVGSWSRPRGGYFLSFEGPPGTASAVVDLAGQAGVKLTPAGATFPYGRDPNDTNIRLAPTYPSMEELDQAMPIFVTAVALIAARQRLEVGAARA